MRTSSPILPIFLIVLVDIVGFTLVIPLLSIYAETFHATPLQATLLVSVYAICQLISGPILGRASDRVGRKAMLLLSQAGTFIGFIVLARANALWVLYLARIIDGATAGNISIAQAYISDNSLPEDRAKSFAYIGIAFGVGFFIGPSTTAWLVQYGISAPIYAAAALSLTSILCTTFLLPGGRPNPPRPGREPAVRVGYLHYFARPTLSGLLGQFFCFIFSFSVFTSGFALFAERRFRWAGHPFGPREIGFSLAYLGFLGIIMQGLLVGRMVRSFGESRVVVAGFASLLVGYTALGVVTGIGGIALCATVLAFGNGIVRPALASLVSRTANRNEQGAVLGVNQSVQALGGILAPIVGGMLIGHSQLVAWAWVPAAFAGLGLIGARWGSGLVRPATLLASSER